MSIKPALGWLALLLFLTTGARVCTEPPTPGAALIAGSSERVP